jgi:hypothetical protein
VMAVLCRSRIGHQRYTGAFEAYAGQRQNRRDIGIGRKPPRRLPRRTAKEGMRGGQRIQIDEVFGWCAFPGARGLTMR